MSNAFFANRANEMLAFRHKISDKHHPAIRATLVCAEVEALIADLRQFMLHAQNDGDAFEYYRLCEELRLAEAARAASNPLALAN